MLVELIIRISQTEKSYSQNFLKFIKIIIQATLSQKLMEKNCGYRFLKIRISRLLIVRDTSGTNLRNSFPQLRKKSNQCTERDYKNIILS